MTDHIAAGHIIGTLHDHPERKVTKNGTAVTNFRVHCEGEIEGRKWTGTYKVVLWGHECDDFFAASPAKGDLIEVDGRLANRKWDKDGQEVWIQEVVGSAKVLEAIERVNPTDPSPTEMDSNDPNFIPF